MVNLSVSCDYVRHADQIVCSLTRDVTLGGHMAWKEIWQQCMYPGHRLFRVEVVTVDGVPFAEWSLRTGWPPREKHPLRNTALPAKKKGKRK